jgi:carboxyl-terminal processing protease
MALDEAVSMIRGPSGSTVKLGILRGKWKEAREYKIGREKITIKSVESKSLSKDIYYIKLNTFENNNAGMEMSKAIEAAKDEKAKGIILDLRNNGGGLLRIAVDIGSMFINDGVIVYTVDREGRRETLSSTGRPIWEKPLVVLVNESSASASEILSGALQDDGIATIVGTHTFGKAYVQNVRQLDDGSAILLTIAKYYTPAGHDISKKGIIPDVLMEMPNASSEEAEEMTTVPEVDDVQLKKAVEVLKDRIIKSAQE